MAEKNPNLCLLYGKETYFLENVLKKIKKDFGDLIKGINYITLDQTNVQVLISEIQTPAFGYEKKLILARDTGLFKKAGKKTKGSPSEWIGKVAEYLEEHQEEMKESVVLVFVEEEIDKNELYKTMDKIGTIQSFAEEKPAQIVARLKSICQAYEVKADQPTLAYLVEMCGTNMQELINEIRKLIEYAGKGGTIDKKAVDLLCTRKPDSVIFNLTDYLGKKEIANAFRVLQDLKYQKEPTQLILIMLYNHFKKLYYTKKATEQGRQDLITLLNLKPNQDFLVSKYRTQAGRFQTEDLRGLLESLADLDYQSKQGTIDIDIGLEAILCQYCA